MNTNLLKYKDYHGTIEPDLDRKCLRGKVLYIDDLVTYEAESVSELEKEFQKSVDDYLAFCKEIGKKPQKPYKGTFNIRISPECHKRLAVKAQQLGYSINEAVRSAIEKWLNDTSHEVTYNHKVEFQLKSDNRIEEKKTPETLFHFEPQKVQDESIVWN